MCENVQKSMNGMDIKDAFNLICDSFTRYRKLTYMLGIPACPTLVFCAVLARPHTTGQGKMPRLEVTDIFIGGQII